MRGVDEGDEMLIDIDGVDWRLNALGVTRSDSFSVLFLTFPALNVYIYFRYMVAIRIPRSSTLEC